MGSFQHRLARGARIAAALSAIGAFMIGGAPVAGAATISDFGATGLNWVASPTGGTPGWTGSATQNFTNAAGSGVDLSVTASTNMWDGLPNVYGGDAPAPGMAPALRFTNNSGGAPTTLTFTFSAPVTVSAFTVGSLSSIGTNWENATVTAFDASNNAVAAAGTSTDRFLTGGNSPVTPGGAVVLSSAGNSYQVRGGGAQELGQYDRMTFDFGTTAINRIEVSQVMRSGNGASDPIVGSFASETVDQIVFAPAASGYDLALTNTLVSYTPGATQATFRVTVCNQGTAASGAATINYVVPTGAGYLNPSTSNPDGRFLELTLPASLAAGASTTFDVVVGFPANQSTPLVTAAEIGTDSGADVDSTPSVTPAFGAANEDDRVSTADACGVNTDASEDDRDIVALNLSAQVTTTTTTTTTGPTTTTTRVVTPGPGVSPATLPVTGAVDGNARNPLVLLAVALPVSWMGVVLALRARRLHPN